MGTVRSKDEHSDYRFLIQPETQIDFLRATNEGADRRPIHFA